MAEVAVATVIIKTLAIAADPLFAAGTRAADLLHNIRWIETQMRTLQSYLKDAESKRAANHQMANLIISIQDLALDLEDILDTYLPTIESHNKMGSFHFVKHISCILCYCAAASDFALEIDKIKKRVESIEVSRASIGVVRINDDIDYEDTWDRRKSFLLAHESNIIGRGEILHKLRTELRSTDPSRNIILLVGPAGVGKTTVAKKVYENMKYRFDCFAAVYVSQDPKRTDLLLDIAKQVGLSKHEREENLELHLLFLLQKKKYLIFLDDIWSTRTWDLLKNCIPTYGRKGSRIIVTSRYLNVARYIGGEHSLVPLNHLKEDESLELFYDLILPAEEKSFPNEVKDVAEKIVNRCSGLPLAIVAAVGMLKEREISKHTWNDVLESISEIGENDCLKILALSYQDLPTELKPFFMYFGLFPKGHEFFVSELVEIWVAEKFIPVNGSRNPEDIVLAKLDKLISRNLIQVSRKRFNGRIKSCRIHDLLHSLCIQMAWENSFFCTADNLKSTTLGPSFGSSVRRVTTSSCNVLKDTHPFENFIFPHKLRVLLCFSQQDDVFKFLKRHASDLKFLRVLIIEVEGRNICLPKEIAKLTGLIYLKLKGDFLAIPSGICNLKNLLTLEVRLANTRALPRSIWKMKHLKNFLLNGISLRPPLIKCMCVNPFIIRNSYTCWCNSFNANSFEKPSNLRKLHIHIFSERILDILSDSVSGLLKVEELKLWATGEFSCRNKVIDLSRYCHMVKLELNLFTVSGEIVSVEFPPNIVQITLILIDVDEALVKSLKKLSKLEILKLKYCTIHSRKLDFSGDHSFPQLQALQFVESPFDEIIVDEKGMLKLEKLVFRSRQSSLFLQNIPERLRMLVTC
ncbi:toMV susceptible protein tm-2-like [Henckelia pumila]|uniref:toMV susceptible protein tm-2-like n=1 Tax=Henckelia pumila TaxID=405737 RepID=UPI003C6E4CB8